MRNKLIVLAAAVLALAALPVVAGEWHSGQANLCSDCHTMHFSQQHNWDSDATPSTTPAPLGNWLGTTGPNPFLLKLPANELCLACHNGQTFAPDVLGVNVNASPTQGRSAGAVNDPAIDATYEHWWGHTLESTDVPPGYDPAIIGASDWYDETAGLECTSCHAQHGPVTSYRNLGPYALGGAASSVRPTYVIDTTNVTTQDVWINIPAGYTANSGDPNIFNPYYDNASIRYNRNDATAGTNLTSNRLDTFCAACHGDFHGGAGDANIGATPAALDGFLRHPTSQVTIGAAGTQGYGGHSSLSRYVAATTKVKVYTTDYTGFTDAAPGCVSCHKAHGNMNPFGLMFLNRDATGIDEQGGWNATQTQDLIQGYRNLCGQCHGQGN